LLAMRAMRLHGHASVKSPSTSAPGLASPPGQNRTGQLSFWLVKMSDPTVPLWLQCRVLGRVRDLR
jgi:hypothetical protein